LLVALPSVYCFSSYDTATAAISTLSLHDALPISAYLRQLPAALAGINLQYGLTANRAEQIKTLETDDGRVELRAVTSPDYGRIRSEEHTSELQSREKLVCRLLLEKKKQKTKEPHH